jgi:proton-coupled amino acid transporter
MSTPQTISDQRPRQPASPFQALSFSNRDPSPRAASLARLAQSPVGSTPQHRSGTATPRSPQPGTIAPLAQDFHKIDAGTYGSLGSRQANTSALSRQEWHAQDEDPDIIRKHLVSGFGRGSRASSPPVSTTPDAEASRTLAAGDDGPLSEEFNSLQLQGGDMTRQVYRYAEESARRSSVHQRSHSFSYPVRHDVAQETVQDIMVPGGFRRNFIQRAYTQPVFGEDANGRPTFVTRNFLHFLTLYGHFAGEDLEEWDEPITGTFS